MTTLSHPERVTVTPEDREAAKAYWNSAVSGWREQTAQQEALVQAFARHAQQAREAERKRCINTPETTDFMAGVPLEAAHQRERWGSNHDAGKLPFDWFWLVGYLAQKAATSAVAGDAEKAKHHTISTAAALANWHAALTGADTSMRPGIAAIRALPEQGNASHE